MTEYNATTETVRQYLREFAADHADAGIHDRRTETEVAIYADAIIDYLESEDV